MTGRGENILRQALALAEEERAEIASALLESLEPPRDEAVERAWREEIRRRLQELDSGHAHTRGWERIRDRLNARLRGRPD